MGSNPIARSSFSGHNGRVRALWGVVFAVCHPSGVFTNHFDNIQADHRIEVNPKFRIATYQRVS
ncbi:MAG: hypothetical protein AAYR33_07855 [Acetobacteraceae bacterium]